MRTRIPYGYRIVNGLAEPDQEQTERLKTFFETYLDGYSIRDAAAIAGIDRTLGCCRRMLTNPVYLGDAYYPPLLSESLIKRAQEEAAKRAAHLVGRAGAPVKKPVPVQTRFALGKKLPSYSKDPAEYAAQLYSRIRQRN